MKRVREADEHCLLLLSKIGSGNNTAAARLFRCKTCDKQFTSFQALGGHRASHKKPKLQTYGDGRDPVSLPEKKPKAHECSICGLAFPLGQAPGGHMRRHRAEVAAQVSEGGFATRDLSPAFGRSGSNKCLDLDLSLHLGPPSIHCFM